MPTRHGVPSRLRADRADVAAEIDEAVAQAVLEADRRDAVGRVFLADAAEVDLHAGARQAHVRRAPFDLAPRDERDGGGELVAAPGSTGGSRWKSHTRRSTPDVMSNRPSLSAWHWSA